LSPSRGRECKGKQFRAKPLPLLRANSLLLCLNFLLHLPKSNIPLRLNPSDPKRKRESKGKEVVKVERSRPSSEEDSQQAVKQQKVGHMGPEKRVDPLPEPQAWLPAPMLNRAPLMDNASIRDFQGGVGSHVADALEGALLLPLDMAKLRSFRRGRRSSLASRGTWAW